MNRCAQRLPILKLTETYTSRRLDQITMWRHTCRIVGDNAGRSRRGCHPREHASKVLRLEGGRAHLITFCATEEWICQFGCARAPFVQRRLTAEASSQLHALGDRAHEEMVGTRVPSARGGILVGDGFGMSRSPCYASCVACFAVKFLLKRQSAGHVCSRQPLQSVTGDLP